MSLKGRPRLPITDKQVRDAWASGHKLSVIASDLGCCVGTVAYRVKLLGLPLRHPKRGKRLSPESRAEVAAMLRADTPAHAIAEMFGVHRTSVDKIRRKMGGKLRNVYRWDRSKLRVACEQGMTLDEIATAINRPPSTVRHALKRMGLQARKDNNRYRIDVAAFVADWKRGASYRWLAARYGFKTATTARNRIIVEVGHCIRPRQCRAVAVSA